MRLQAGGLEFTLAQPDLPILRRCEVFASDQDEAVMVVAKARVDGASCALGRA